MAFDHDLDAVRLVEVPQPEFPPRPYPYLVENGMHRFYAAVVLGFDNLPRAVE